MREGRPRVVVGVERNLEMMDNELGHEWPTRADRALEGWQERKAREIRSLSLGCWEAVEMRSVTSHHQVLCGK